MPAGVNPDPFRKWCIGNRVPLDVPFHEKDDAKAKGAKWDAKRGQWFFTDNMNETPFNKWRRVKAPGRLTSTWPAPAHDLRARSPRVRVMDFFSTPLRRRCAGNADDRVALDDSPILNP